MFLVFLVFLVFSSVPLPTDNVNIQCSCGVGGQLARAIHRAHSVEAETLHSCEILLRLGSNIKQEKLHVHLRWPCDWSVLVTRKDRIITEHEHQF